MYVGADPCFTTRSRLMCCTLAFHWKKEPRSALSFERPVSLLFSALSKRME